MAQTQTPKTPTIAADVLANGTTDNPQPYGLRLRFSNGKVLTLDARDLTEAMQNMAMVHGLKQKLVDAAAISRNAETGRSASVDDKYEAVREVLDRITGANGADPSWNATREGGGSGSLLFKALCRVYDQKAPEAIREWLDARTDAEKAALRKNPKVARAILDIQAESVKTGDVDSDALLSSLE